MALYEPTNQNDKHFFAGLFNTAVDNFDLSLNELKRRANIKDGDSKNIIKNAFNSEKIPINELERNYKYLSNSLTFLKKLPQLYRDKQENFYAFAGEILLKLYETLENLRNYYTHFHHDEIEIDDEIKDFLNTILLHNALEIKKYHLNNHLVLKSLKKNYSETFNRILNNKRNNEIKDDEYVINQVFKEFLYTNPKNKNKVELNHNKNNVHNKKITPGGLTQLLGLFLDKKQMNILFDNFKYTRYNSGLNKKIARWIYTYSSYKPPHYLLKSEFDTDALLLQMVTELSKAPAELYPYLSEDDKEKFIEDVNVYLQEKESTFGDQSLVAHEIIKRRYKDKFTYFALRFLDDVINFPSLRFMVNVGKYIHDKKEKKDTATKKTTTRVVDEDQTVFEKLSVVARKKQQNIHNCNGWEKYPHPFYEFFGESIPIYLDMKENQEIERKSERSNKDKKSRREILQCLDLDDAYKMPVAYISKHELPALLYELLEKTKTPEEIEKIIRAKINRQRGILKSTIDKINKNELGEIKELKLHPKVKRKLKKLQQNEKYDFEKINRLLEQEKQYNPLEEIRKTYKRKLKFPDKLNLKEKGKIATWLSKDIKRFTPQNIRKKWNGTTFSQFQALLSYYDFKKDEVEKYIKETLKISKKDDLPFNGFDFSKISLKKFYDNYLQKRKAFISQILDELKNKNTREQIVDRVVSRLFKPNSIKINKPIIDFLTAKLNQPQMLQRGIFDDKPTNYHPDKKTNDLAEWFLASNNIEEAQEFYMYPRHYTVNDGSKQKTITLQPNKGIAEQYRDETKEIQKFIYKNEQKLRQTRRNDFFILLMIKHMLKKDTEVEHEALDQLTLKDFYLSKDQKQKENDQEKINEGWILNRNVHINMYDGKIKDVVALKKSGKYKKLLLDQKVKILVSYFPDKTWKIPEIEQELSKYEHIRIKELFKKIHELEEEIYKKAQDEDRIDELLKNKNPNFKKYLSYYFIDDPNLKEKWEKISIQNENLQEVDKQLKLLYILTLIRNKFAHNQLPKKPVFDFLQEEYPIENGEKVVEYYNRVFGLIIDNIKK